ncbi:hypothetical protein TI39_contig5954g00001 [Zymoseptoria brevis]|uniref:ML-like domain-containing protein n=1 Tax=Zymoseptoria brevis TaxID=1047168 RepID=A0A0F4G416_9PEZI|nr:hypothetical protein TI39_contig5954g00001 [Zymoseptoria brevis]
MIPRIRMALLALFTFLTCLRSSLAQTSPVSTDKDGNRYVQYTGEDGPVLLADNRRPSLYTADFGDCMGGSTINVTRFDASYYKDNMTVLFHLAGETGVKSDVVMLYIGVFAYGENRFDLVFDPCNANIASLCPMNGTVPIEASGIIPVSLEDVAGIPPIALSIPDFEGEAILRIFSNTTRQQIACYAAVVTNGNSFSHPAAVGSILGIFTFVAMIASFATAIYGTAVPTMRLHYAHSLSVGVVFAVWHHIFFTGALSVNWPSVLVAWWSNFAWSGGMIYSSTMQDSINKLIGNNIGNTSHVGAAQTGGDNTDVGGGFDTSLLYKRLVTRGSNHPLVSDVASKIFPRDTGMILRRDVVQRTLEARQAPMSGGSTLGTAQQGYHWYGDPVPEGLPLPGNFSGFAGTLGQEGIRASNAFMTGFLWFIILLVLLIAAAIAFKWSLEALVRYKRIKQDRLQFFRDHWLGFTAVIALRICYIAFFAMLFLSIFQFSYESSSGVKAIAGIVFIVFFAGMLGVAGYAYWYRRHTVDFESRPQFEHKTLLGKIPWFGFKDAPLQPSRGDAVAHDGNSNMNESAAKPPLWKRLSTGPALAHTTTNSVHDDQDYTRKFGWLAARFRRTRWWFFAFWLCYEFLRAIFYGGASGFARAQVFGLLVIEIVAAGFIIWARPFEGQRLNLLVVYALSFSKVVTVGLSAAFDVEFNLPRIATTALGIIIIVVQGILTILTMIAIVVGSISSYMSLSRNQEGDDFRPKKWAGIREKYFNHLDKSVKDLPREPRKVKKERKKQEKLAKKLAKNRPSFDPEAEPEKAGFTVRSIRRNPKIEDEDELFVNEVNPSTFDIPINISTTTLPQSSATPIPSGSRPASRPVSRAPSVRSVSSGNLPFGARAHRMSWSMRDFQQQQELDAEYAGPASQVSAEELKSMPKALPKDVVDRDRALQERDSTLSIRSSKTRVKKRMSRGAEVEPSVDGATADAEESDTALDIASPMSSVTHLPISAVPPPTMRPRAGTGGSTRNVSSGLLLPVAGLGPSASHSAGLANRSNSMRARSGSGCAGGYGLVVEEEEEEEEDRGVSPVKDGLKRKSGVLTPQVEEGEEWFQPMGKGEGMEVNGKGKERIVEE